MKYPILLCVLATMGSNTLQAGIVLEDTPQDVAPIIKPIDVPNPKDASAANAGKTVPVTDSVRFLNNDTLHGSFIGSEKEGVVRWQSLEAKDPILFQTANLSEIKLDSHHPPAGVKPPAHAVILTNNDELPGNLVSMDDKVLVLETWYAGNLSIPRMMVKSILPLKTSASLLYEGPTGMEGWTVGPRGMNSKSWIYRDGAFISTNYGIIGRDVKLPNLASVEFDLVARGNSQMSVCLYSDRTDNMSNCYMFQINGGFIYLQRFSQNGSSGFGEQVQMRGDLMRRDKMHIAIHANKDTKTIWLYVNGNVVKQWTDPAEWAGKGTSLLFMSQPGMFVRVSNIKVNTWDGQVADARVASAKSKEDNIKMENQDKVSGKLKSIENGKAIFASSYADLTIPLDRVEQITMSSETTDVAKRGPGDVRAYFAGRGSITMALESWDGKQVAASSANFGKAVFSPDAFQRLQFNLNKQPAAGDNDLEVDPGGDGGDSN
jgi:hypothetical protein